MGNVFWREVLSRFEGCLGRTVVSLFEGGVSSKPNILNDSHTNSTGFPSFVPVPGSRTGNNHLVIV
jgi:hypothetical protein